MTESEFLDKRGWYELKIRAQVRAGRYAAIKAQIRAYCSPKRISKDK